MKLFQQLLVAPAALGLMAPMAATATELNINAVSDYAASSEQVTSSTQFSDIQPSDWAHQALTNLAERSSCVAGKASGSMTRYEAAALLNACLDRVVEVTDDVRRLMDEFGPELAVIQGRVDGLEAKVGEFEAGVFSTTTKLSGESVFVLGGISYEDRKNAGGKGIAKSDDAISFNYATRLDLDTSFSGQDLLKTRISAGNFGNTPFGGDAFLERAYTSENTDTLEIDRNYYQFPLGDSFTATLGAVIRQDDMLAVWPSQYPSSSNLDVLTYAGANAAYNLKEGQGAGISWANDNGVSASLAYVGTNGANAATGGIMTKEGADDITAQLAYTGDAFGAAVVYTDSDKKSGDYEAWGLSGYWSPDAGDGVIPSVSGGIGFKTLSKETATAKDEFTWTVGLEWNDVGIDGNTLGFGLGSAEGWQDKSGYDDPMAYEVWYDMAVSDNVSVTPSFFIVEKDGDDNNFSGGLIKTTFRF